MTIATRTRRVAYDVVDVQVDGRWFSMETVDEVLGGLESAGVADPIVINDSDLAKALENLKVAFRGTRGSHRRDSGYDAFLAEFNAAVRAHDDENKRLQDEAVAETRAKGWAP